MNALTTENQIASEIRRVRRSAGLTQNELAFRIDVTPTYISKLERGVKMPSVELLMEIAFQTAQRIHLTIGWMGRLKEPSCDS